MILKPDGRLVFGRKWLEFISQSQIKGNYNFSNLPQSQVCLDEIELKIKNFIFYNSSNRIFKICDFPDKCSLNVMQVENAIVQTLLKPLQKFHNISKVLLYGTMNEYTLILVFAKWVNIGYQNIELNKAKS